MVKGYLQTGQTGCYDIQGHSIACLGSGQDAEFRAGIAWPTPRFESLGECVLDVLTGFIWPRNANLVQFPVTWQEALDYVADMNAREAFGFTDWRLPDRTTLRTLMGYATRKPALPEGHPFENVFSGWYWTSTSAAINPRYAWYIHMEGARMFYGRKDQYCLLWPVRGEGYGILPQTGQTKCYDSMGQAVPCSETGQDGEAAIGSPWPEPRFEVMEDAVIDHVTDLIWRRSANLTRGPVGWEEALKAVSQLNSAKGPRSGGWRLPNINELASIVDCAAHSPALTAGHPFVDLQDVYWSSTTSFFEPDWAWALYLVKGALGVGIKSGEGFYVWPVADARAS